MPAAADMDAVGHMREITLRISEGRFVRPVHIGEHWFDARCLEPIERSLPHSSCNENGAIGNGLGRLEAIGVALLSATGG